MQAAEALKKYGPALVAARPEDVTRLLMDLCSPGTDLDGSDYVASVADFAHLFTGRSLLHQTHFLQVLFGGVLPFGVNQP